MPPKKAPAESQRKRKVADDAQQPSKAKKSKVNNSLSSTSNINNINDGTSGFDNLKEHSECNTSKIIVESATISNSALHGANEMPDDSQSHINRSPPVSVSRASQTSTPELCLDTDDLTISLNVSMRASQLVDEIMQLVDAEGDLSSQTGKPDSEEATSSATLNNSLSGSVDSRSLLQKESTEAVSASVGAIAESPADSACISTTNVKSKNTTTKSSDLHSSSQSLKNRKTNTKKKSVGNSNVTPKSKNEKVSDITNNPEIKSGPQKEIDADTELLKNPQGSPLVVTISSVQRQIAVPVSKLETDVTLDNTENTPNTDEQPMLALPLQGRGRKKGVVNQTLIRDDTQNNLLSDRRFDSKSEDITEISNIFVDGHFPSMACKEMGNSNSNQPNCSTSKLAQNVNEILIEDDSIDVCEVSSSATRQDYSEMRDEAVQKNTIQDEQDKTNESKDLVLNISQPKKKKGRPLKRKNILKLIAAETTPSASDDNRKILDHGADYLVSDLLTSPNSAKSHWPESTNIIDASSNSSEINVLTDSVNSPYEQVEHVGSEIENQKSSVPVLQNTDVTKKRKGRPKKKIELTTSGDSNKVISISDDGPRVTRNRQFQHTELPLTLLENSSSKDSEQRQYRIEDITFAEISSPDNEFHIQLDNDEEVNEIDQALFFSCADLPAENLPEEALNSLKRSSALINKNITLKEDNTQNVLLKEELGEVSVIETVTFHSIEQDSITNVVEEKTGVARGSACRINIDVSVNNAKLATTSEAHVTAGASSTKPRKEKKESFPEVPRPSSYPSLGSGPAPLPHTGKKYMGAHISAAGGVHNVFENARTIHAKSFAMFLRNQRQWLAKPYDEKHVALYKDTGKDFAPHLILPHGSYLMNVGSVNPELLQKSRNLLQEELERCNVLGIPHFNFHPGSCVGGTGRVDCCHTIAESINIAHRAVPGVILVLENMCRQGNTIGGDFHELRLIISQVEDRSRVGVCIDTCHAHNAGYDLGTEEGFNLFLQDFEIIIGFQFLRGLHINDSKNVAGAHVDRHENIGKGHIGKAGMKRIMNCAHFNDMPLILETPYTDDAGYEKEIKMLEAMVDTDKKKVSKGNHANIKQAKPKTEQVIEEINAAKSSGSASDDVNGGTNVKNSPSTAKASLSADKNCKVKCKTEKSNGEMNGKISTGPKKRKSHQKDVEVEKQKIAGTTAAKKQKSGGVVNVEKGNEKTTTGNSKKRRKAIKKEVVEGESSVPAAAAVKKRKREVKEEIVEISSSLVAKKIKPEITTDIGTEDGVVETAKNIKCEVENNESDPKIVTKTKKTKTKKKKEQKN